MNLRDTRVEGGKTTQRKLKEARENVKLGNATKEEKERVQNYDGPEMKKKKRKSTQKANAKQYGNTGNTISWKCPENHEFDKGRS